MNEAKVLAHPASVDNVPTDGGKEDHVSMGMTAATKMRSIVESRGDGDRDRVDDSRTGVGVSLPLHPGRGVKQAYNIVRGSVPPTESDRSMSEDIEKIVDLIRRDEFQVIY